ncbi:phage terminase large subunit [Christensenellaceae bacterium OttesenSCG-928-M15]|nr:phage terminase large subunit [Christensenellaceae bacterium OttesenSCG-928-M15]
MRETNRKRREEAGINDHALRELTLEYLRAGNEPYRAQLLKEFLAGASLKGEDGIRKKLAAMDMAYFGRAYLSHYFSKPSPKFHAELDAIWLEGVLKNEIPLGENARMINVYEGCRRAIAAPRGHAKSTNLTFKGSLHAVLYKYKRYIIILSDSSDQACGFLSAIKDELEENTAVREDFGDLVGKTWRENVVVTKHDVKIEAIGAGQKIRGRKHKNWRPDLIILDDVENDENVRTPEQRNKLNNWFTKAVSKAGDGYTDIVYIGTLLHYDSLLAKVLGKPKYKSIKYKAVISFSESPLWDKWKDIYIDLTNPDHEANALAFFEANEAEMLAGTEVLWEEKNSYYYLMTERISDGDAAFNSELQNEPINPDDCLFKEEWFEYFNPEDMDFSSKDYRFYGFVDPSLGKTKRADYSAILTGALELSTGYLYIVDADIARRHPDMIISDTLQKAVWIKKTWGKRYTKFGVETVQFQWFLKEQLAKASAKARIYLPIEEVPQSSDKVLRIQTLQPDVKNKYIKFNPRHKLLLEQLKYFPMADHDDGPDALEGLRTIAQGGHKKRLIIKKKRRFGI